MSTPAIPSGRAEVNLLQEVLRFLRVVRHRKAPMILSLMVAGLLGGLYHATSTPVYESQATLLILQSGSDTMSVGMSGEGAVKDLMATYRTMFTGEEVLEKALELLPKQHQIDFRDVPRERWAQVLKRNLSVNTARGENVLNIVYRSKHPRTAAAVVNASVTAYLDFMDTLHQSTAREILDVLTKDKAKLEEQLREKEAQLVEKRSQSGELVIRDGNQGLNVVVKRAMSINDALMEAHEVRLDAQSKLTAIENGIRSGENLQQHAVSISDAVGREMLLQQLGLSSGDTYAMSRMNEQLMRSQAELQTLLQLYGPSHSKVRELKEQIRVSDEYLGSYREKELLQLRSVKDAQLAPVLLNVARQTLNQALEHERALYESYEQEKQRAIALDRGMTELEVLELDLTRLRKFYDVVLQRIADIDLGEENGMLRTAVLSSPEVPTGPVWPRLSIIGLVAMIAGGSIGLAIVYVQDLLDDRFRTPEELRLQLGVPLLAMLQEFKPLATAGRDALHVHVRPTAVESEAFRTLRTALALSAGDARSIVISSSEPGDGKTTVSSNLAAVYAQSGKRTLLIDADLRRPGLTPLLDLKGRHGLSTLLRDDAPIEDAFGEYLVADFVKNLDVIPSGPRPTNPAELLAGERFQELLAWAEQQYDQVLIDSPPAVVSDAASIGRHVDGMVMVMQPQKNPRRLLIRITEGLQAMQINLLGVVVNRLSDKQEGGYYGYGYGYGYNYNYGHDDEHEAEAVEPDYVTPEPRMPEPLAPQDNGIPLDGPIPTDVQTTIRRIDRPAA